MNSYGHIIHTNLPALLKKCEKYMEEYSRKRMIELVNQVNNTVQYGFIQNYQTNVAYFNYEHDINLIDFIPALKWAIDNDIEEMYVAVELLAKVDSYGEKV